MRSMSGVHAVALEMRIVCTPLPSLARVATAAIAPPFAAAAAPRTSTPSLRKTGVTPYMGVPDVLGFSQATSNYENSISNACILKFAPTQYCGTPGAKSETCDQWR